MLKPIIEPLKKGNILENPELHKEKMDKSMVLWSRRFIFNNRRNFFVYVVDIIRNYFLDLTSLSQYYFVVLR